MKVVWIPRRHRSLVYKLLILIPVAWLTIAFLFYNGNNINNEHQQPEDETVSNVPATAKQHIVHDVVPAGASGEGGSRYVLCTLGKNSTF